MRNLQAKSEKVLTVEAMYNKQVTILSAPVLLRVDESCQNVRNRFAVTGTMHNC